MNIFQKLNKLLLIIFLVLYPILPSYGIWNADLLIIFMAISYFLSIIFIQKSRLNFLINIKNIKKDFLLLSIIFFNITMYLSVFVAYDKRMTLGNSLRFSMYVFIFYLVTYHSKTKKELLTLIQIFTFTTFIISIVTVFQTLFIVSNKQLLDESHRIISTLENSNNLGAFSLLSFFVILSFLFSSKNKKSKIYYSLLLLLLLFNIVTSQSRNAILALIVGGFFLVFIYNKKYVIYSFILPIILFIIPQSRIRILEIFDISQNSSRIKLWKTAIEMIKDYPVKGIGYETFGSYYRSYIEYNPDLMIWHSYKADHPHNIFLKIQAELGIIGTISFILFLLSILILFYKLIKSCRDSTIRFILIGLLTSSISFQFMNLIDSFYSSPKIVITMLLLLGFANSYRNLIDKAK